MRHGDTENNLKEIEEMSHEQMESLFRFAPAGHPAFVSGSAECLAFQKRFRELGGLCLRCQRRSAGESVEDRGMDPVAVEKEDCEFCGRKYKVVERSFCGVRHCGRKRCVDLCEECQEWIGIIMEMLSQRRSRRTGNGEDRK